MNTEVTRDAARLDDAIYALAQIGPELNATSLDQLVRRFPEHAAELTDLAIELLLEVIDEADIDPNVVDSPSAEVTSMVSQAMSHFQNQLYAAQSEQAAKSEDILARPESLFLTWDRTQFRSFGLRLGANTVFAMKLRDCLIDTDTMTPGFKQHTAAAAQAPLNVVVASFSGRSLIRASSHFKADAKPAIGKKQTLEEAVRTSGLSKEQQEFLLSL